MHSTERRRYGHYALVTATALLSGCTTVSLAPEPPPVQTPRAEPARLAPVPAPTPATGVLKLEPGPRLGPPRTPRNAAELSRQAAERLVAANPDQTYMGKPQDILLAIPVLEVELNADGSIKRVIVMRKPGQAPETVQLAIDAVFRAAPFGDVSRLPKPWRFIETFLFNDDHRFKPRTLDGG